MKFIYIFVSAKDNKCQKKLETFSVCSETMLQGLVDTIKNMPVEEKLKQRKKFVEHNKLKKAASKKTKSKGAKSQKAGKNVKKAAAKKAAVKSAKKN